MAAFTVFKRWDLQRAQEEFATARRVLSQILTDAREDTRFLACDAALREQYRAVERPEPRAALSLAFHNFLRAGDYAGAAYIGKDHRLLLAVPSTFRPPSPLLVTPSPGHPLSLPAPGQMMAQPFRLRTEKGRWEMDPACWVMAVSEKPGHSVVVLALSPEVLLRRLRDSTGLKEGCLGLVDAQGTYLAHLEFPRSGSRPSPGPGPHPVGQVGAFRREVPHLAERVLPGRPGSTWLGGEYVAAAPLFYEWEWSGPAVLFVYRRPLHPPAQLLSALLAVLSFALLFGAFCSQVLATVFAHRLARPLGRLQERVQRMGEGELDRPVSVQADDEIDQLAASLEGMRGQLRDFTGELERRLRERTEELRAEGERTRQAERRAALADLAQRVAHEVRNPLGAIATSAEALKLSESLTEEDRDLLGLIETEVQRLDRLVGDFLQFGRPTPPRPVPVDLPRVTEEILHILQHDTDWAPEVRVTTQFPVDLPPLAADEHQLRQVLWNVLVNSLQAMEGHGELHLTAAVQDGQVVLTLADTGPGLSPDELARAFEPFFTTRTEGSGLGLPIVRQIVEDHGGMIRMESEVGKGATVTIAWPVVGHET
jgi:signal transduction histidine kinase